MSPKCFNCKHYRITGGPTNYATFIDGSGSNFCKYYFERGLYDSPLMVKLSQAEKILIYRSPDDSCDNYEGRD
ncbi:MAG: hypothetical protein A2252_09525 [Elusimicrobia bacterium RIFOXYA2_FULL_39_19]|nr:MAG: hypothetical protein A2252_09525 [Elusimicrobia bacterium RIFOXYA2_FULL_39_19]